MSNSDAIPLSPSFRPSLSPRIYTQPVNKVAVAVGSGFSTTASKTNSAPAVKVGPPTKVSTSGATNSASASGALGSSHATPFPHELLATPEENPVRAVHTPEPMKTDDDISMHRRKSSPAPGYVRSPLPPSLYMHISLYMHTHHIHTHILCTCAHIRPPLEEGDLRDMQREAAIESLGILERAEAPATVTRLTNVTNLVKRMLNVQYAAVTIIYRGEWICMAGLDPSMPRRLPSCDTICDWSTRFSPEKVPCACIIIKLSVPTSFTHPRSRTTLPPLVRYTTHRKSLW